MNEYELNKSESVKMCGTFVENVYLLYLLVKAHRQQLVN